MKPVQIISLALLSVVLTACPRTSEPSISKVQSNGMNFPDPEKRSHNGISYELSSVFKDSYYTDFVIQSNATTKSIYDMQIHFSVETFNKNDIQSLEFLTDSKEGSLALVHDHYIKTRIASLAQHSTSIRKKLGKKVGFPGFIQVVEGGSEYDQKWTTYMTSSIMIDGKVYVFQLVGPKDHMGHFYDDFLRILNSIEK